MRVPELLRTTKETLQSAGVETAALDARLLVQRVLDLSQEELIVANDQEVSADDLAALKNLLDRRVAREPVSRILGVREFWGLEFQLSPDTLDPRPDSETLIETVLKQKPLPQTILDLGTGSGCLLLALLSELPEATGVGIDLSEGAITTAQKNAENLGLADRAAFVAQSWTDPVKGAPFDLVISNPPYIETNQIPDLQPEVHAFDPLRALDGGEDGLVCYRQIAELLHTLVTPNGACVLEVGFNQAKQVTDILKDSGLSVAEVTQDLAGNDRCLIVRF